MVKRVFIIHGWDGVPNDSWKPWLTKQLEEKGYQVISPQMPGGNNPLVEEWTAVIKKLVNKPTKNDYFVGHSLGCISICRYLESLKENEKIGGCVFVAGFASSLDVSELENFCEPKLNFESVKKHSGRFVAIHSDDDEDVPMEKALELKNGLNAQLIIEHEKGHMSEGDGIKELPSLLKSILEISV